MAEERKNAACDRKELIRRSLDDCFAIEGKLYRWTAARNRGITLLGQGGGNLFHVCKFAKPQ